VTRASHIASVMRVRIRTAVPGDLPALRHLFRRSSLSVEAFREVLLAHREELELSDSGVVDGRTRVAVASDGTIVGFITRLSLGRSALEVEDLFVDPDHMRAGVARRLMSDLAAAARHDGITAIQVTANPHAVAYYRSVGFVHLHDTETRFGSAPRMQLSLRTDEVSEQNRIVDRDGPT
jgi:GNAT superfamily N-acetyltransferase